MKSIALALIVIFPIGSVAYGATDREVILEAQLSATRAQLDAARAQLATAPPPAKSEAQQTKDAVVNVQQAAQAIANSSSDTAAEISILRMQLPINSVPVWLAAISGMVSVFGMIASITLTILNKGKLNAIHILANSNLARISSELSEAHVTIADMRAESNKPAA